MEWPVAVIQAPATVWRARAPRSALLALGLLAVAVVITFYVELYRFSPSRGMDFAILTAAATALGHHANPYDPRVLIPIQELQAHQWGPGADAWFRVNPYLPPPLLAALLRPLGHGTAALYAWTALQVGALLAAAALAARWAGAPRRLQAIALLPLSPACYLAVYYGQLSPFMLLCVCGALLLASRRPELAGAVLVVGMLKPQIMAGALLVLAIDAYRAGRLRRFLRGVVGAGLVLVFCMLLTAGPGVVLAWVQRSAGFADAHIGQEMMDPASLSFILYGQLPSRLATAATALLIVAWAVIAARAYPCAGEAAEQRTWVAAALAGWLLVTPYAHPHDDALLLPALCVLLGRGMRATTAIALACWVGVPLLWLLGLRVPVVYGLGALAPAAMLIALVDWPLPGRRTRSDAVGWASTRAQGQGPRRPR
jgi:hypothetical protein